MVDRDISISPLQIKARRTKCDILPPEKWLLRIQHVEIIELMFPDKPKLDYHLSIPITSSRYKPTNPPNHSHILVYTANWVFGGFPQLHDVLPSIMKYLCTRHCGYSLKSGEWRVAKSSRIVQFAGKAENQPGERERFTFSMWHPFAKRATSFEREELLLSWVLRSMSAAMSVAEMKRAAV